MKLLVQHVLAKRSECADEEEEGKTIVHLAVRELALRTNDTPDDRRSAEHLRAGANEATFSLGGTDALDVGEQPSLDTELDGTADDGRNDLAPEHGARRNLHVVTELEVGRELQRLRHGDVPPRLEHHHCDRAARQRVSDDELRDDAAQDT